MNFLNFKIERCKIIYKEMRFSYEIPQQNEILDTFPCVTYQQSLYNDVLFDD